MNGHVHRAVSAMASPFIGYSVLHFFPDRVDLAALAALGDLAGMVIHPDLDQAERKAGFWFGYGLLFKHRGMSHWPIFGTLTRIVYILVWPIAFLALAAVVLGVKEWHIPGDWIKIAPYVIAFLYGLLSSDMLHLLFDIFKEDKRA